MQNVRWSSWTILACAFAACGSSKTVDDGSGDALGDVQFASDIQFGGKDGGGNDLVKETAGDSGASDAHAPGTDVEVAIDAAAGSDVESTSDVAGGSDALSALDGSSDSATSTGCEFAANPLGGEPGAPCADNASCDSGYCVDSANGKICSMTCVSCCPSGFQCGQIPGSSDNTYVCFAQFIALCRPCNTDVECGAVNAGALCVSAGDSGSFCGGACSKDADCPSGYGCKASQGEKGAGQQCVLLSGACGCSKKSTFDGAATQCAQSNGFGSCAGTRKCGLSGLSACSAATPAQELCNGKDDNCDGVTDGGDSADCVTYWKDGDSDGAGVGAGACTCGPVGLATATTNGDCDDDAKAVHPGAKEICNDIDDNCNGVVDEGCDDDGDGYCDATMVIVGSPVVCKYGVKDCNDADASVHPNAPEICGNGVDDDCNGVTDDNASTTFYLDSDGDGFGNGKVTQLACAKPAGYVTVGGDCDDNNAGVHPGAAEICDGLDDDCDGTTDGTDLSGCKAYFADADGDGFGVGASSCLCKPDGSWTANVGGDCDDALASVHPGAVEACNGIDDNCNGATDEADASGCTPFYPDADGDGFGAVVPGKCLCAADGTYKVSKSSDCNDTNPSVHPKANEHCNGVDDDCDGVTDPAGSEGCSNYYLDGDGDGYGIASGGSKCLCAAGGAYSTLLIGDCDDTVKTIFPGATEVCNGADDNCNGEIDEGVTTLFYVDADKDGYGAASVSVASCSAPPGYVADSSDCDGAKASVHPGAAEICNGVDDNCDGVTDPVNSGNCTTYYADADLDGAGSKDTPGSCLCAPASPYTVTSQMDCNDSIATIHPGATETCNGVDDNCNGSTDEGVTSTFYQDSDGDGYGSGVTANACTAPFGYVSISGDCADGASSIHPNAAEVCNGLDDNCNGAADEGVTLAFYLDFDGDKYGDVNHPIQACTAPSGYVSDHTDCDDVHAYAHPGASETCNGVDDNCNGTTDEGVTTTYYQDNDKDGYGSSVTSQACSLPTGYVAVSGDCNDASAAIHPGVAEICNGVDDNCNGSVDEGVKNTYFQDADNDGYGNPNVSQQACSAPANFVSNNTDCLDSNASVNPGMTESCGAGGAGNGLDDNCNGTVDEGCTPAICSARALDDFHNSSVGCTVSGWTGGGWCLYGGYGEGGWGMGYYANSGYPSTSGTTAYSTAKYAIQAGDKYLAVDVMFNNVTNDSGPTLDANAKITVTATDGTTPVSVIFPAPASFKYQTWYPVKVPIDASWVGKKVSLSVTLYAPKTSYATNQYYPYAGFGFDMVRIACN